ncbi:MAG TPA: polyphenol oxidase family protein [Solirubrobacterales bacterium]|nr:polyphenol oxidase family protein [Solirubrobacterales bacterium]
MQWRSAGEVKWLEARLPGSVAVFSTRSCGSAKESHIPLATALEISPDLIVSGHQAHGAELAFHEVAVAGIPDVDGHVITKPGPVGLVYTADCLPVAVAGPGGVAMLHCGWRGLAAGIVGCGAKAVGATHAVIGPGIGPCCYEVRDDVLDAFAGLGPGVASGRMLDLPEVARRLLRETGVREIESATLCTCCEEELFFSHRRDAGPGRQAGLAWIEAGGR